MIIQAQCPPNLYPPTMDLQNIKVCSLQERIHALYLATVVFGLDYLSLQCFFSELFVFVLFVFVLFVFVLFVFVLFIFALFVFVVFVLSFCYLFLSLFVFALFPTSTVMNPKTCKQRWSERGRGKNIIELNLSPSFLPHIDDNAAIHGFAN